VVDEYCQTNIAGIYAAGDVARHFHPLVGRHIRVEHYQNAISQGMAAARNMLGKQQAYTEVHWFWSDQYKYKVKLKSLLSSG
jgi:3-phenylpropionate/trans-cinnamate dioxygenase ferredoxin reductase subunit